MPESMNLEDKSDFSELREMFKNVVADQDAARAAVAIKNPFYDIPNLLNEQDKIADEIAEYIDSINQPRKFDQLMQVYIYNQKIFNRVIYDQVRSMHHPKLH